MALTLSCVQMAQAAPQLRVQVDQRGDFILIGNTLGHECATGTPAPVVGAVGNCGTNTADSAPDIFWRSDSPAAGQAQANNTITPAQARSTAFLNLPPGSSVTHAFLYWSAIGPGGVADADVTLERPGGFSEEIQALQTFTAPNNAYSGVADITDLVQTHGSGAYRVSGVNSINLVDLNNNNGFAGWWMVVFHERASDPFRSLVLSDGLDAVSMGVPQNFNLSGFLVPNAGFTGRLGVVALEGDNSITGDSLLFNGVTLTDGQNPANNFFNGTRSNLGNPVSVVGDLPQLTGTAQSMSGIDIDVVDVTGLLSPGQTSATIQASSTGDVYLLASFVTAIDTFRPQFGQSLMQAVDLNGGDLMPGDLIEITVDVANSGNDTALATVLELPLPPELNYEPGSLAILSGPNSGPKSDEDGDDQAEFLIAQGKALFRLGSGANAADGGSLAVGEASQVRLRARVGPRCSSPVLIQTQASISARGQLSGATFSDLSDADPLQSGSQPASLLLDVRCLDVAIDGPGGTVSSNPPGIDCGGDCSLALTAGSSVTLTASAQPEADFIGWSGDASGSNPELALVLNDDLSIIASFRLRQAITGFATDPPAPIYSPGGSFSVNAQGGGSGNPVLFDSLSTGICTVLDTTVTILAAGTCRLSADQAGDGDYLAAPQAVFEVEIARAPQDALSLQAVPAVLGIGESAELQAMGGSGTGGLSFAILAGLDRCELDGTTVTALAGGACTASVTRAGDDNYLEATASTQIVVIGEGVDLRIGIERILPTTALLADGLNPDLPIAVYRIFVGSEGPPAIQGARLRIESPAGLIDALWSCSAPSGPCVPAVGAGAGETLFDIAPGEVVQVALSGEVDFAEDVVRIEASIEPPPWHPTINPGDDQAVLLESSATRDIFRDDFE